VAEAKGRNFYDQDYFEARSRQSVRHTHDIIYPLAERTARFLCRRLQPRCVMDIGCAKGFLVEAFRAVGVPAVFGADISLYAISEGTAAVRGRIMVADIQTGIPLRSASCDLVTAIDLFEHLPSPEPALCEIGRVLRSNGVAYLKICHPKHPNTHRDPSHVNVQPLRYWRQAFWRAGFQSERLFEAEFAPDQEGFLGRLKAWVRRWREWAVIGTPADYKFLLRRYPTPGSVNSRGGRTR
jgi:SAM-dependent methyltransferase